MGQPKKKTSRRRTGNRRSHFMGQLAKAVNQRSSVKVHSPRTARRLKKLASQTSTAPAKAVAKPAPAKARPAKPVTKPASQSRRPAPAKAKSSKT